MHVKQHQINFSFSSFVFDETLLSFYLVGFSYCHSPGHLVGLLYPYGTKSDEETLFMYLQHLIEMLNRNQHYSSQLHDLEQEQELEQEEQQRHQQEEDIAAAQRRQQVIEAQRRYEEQILRQEQEKLVDVAPFTSSNKLDNDDEGQKDIFGLTAGTSQTKESLEQGMTQPFSPKASTSYDFTGVTQGSSSSGTRGEAVSVERTDVMRQETSEDVNDIEEDIVDNGKQTDHSSEEDDGFNF